MSTIKMDSEKLAEIRNALTIILSNTEMTSRKLCKAKFLMERINKEVLKIDRLLPKKNSNRWIIINSLSGLTTRIKIDFIQQTQIDNDIIGIQIEKKDWVVVKRYNQNTVEKYLKEREKWGKKFWRPDYYYEDEEIGRHHRESLKKSQEESEEYDRYYMDALDKNLRGKDWKEASKNTTASGMSWLKDKNFDHLKQQLESLSDKFALNAKKGVKR